MILKQRREAEDGQRSASEERTLHETLERGTPEERLRALDELARAGKFAPEIIAHGVKSTHEAIRWAALKELAITNRDSAGPKLEAMLLEGKVQEIAPCLEVAALLPPPWQRSVWRAALRSSNAALRLHALPHVAAHADHDDIDALLEAWQASLEGASAKSVRQQGWLEIFVFFMAALVVGFAIWTWSFSLAMIACISGVISLWFQFLKHRERRLERQALAAALASAIRVASLQQPASKQLLESVLHELRHGSRDFVHNGPADRQQMRKAEHSIQEVLRPALPIVAGSAEPNPQPLPVVGEAAAHDP